MASLYEELAEKLRAEPGFLKRGGPRQDIGLILFANREAIDELWKAAERHLAARDGAGSAETLVALREAVESLRPIFGEPGSVLPGF